MKLLVAHYPGRPSHSIDLMFPDYLICMFITHATYNGATRFYVEDY